MCEIDDNSETFVRVISLTNLLYYSEYPSFKLFPYTFIICG